MSRVQWYVVTNPQRKAIPEWRRSFGISEDSSVLVPAAMAGVETELNVMLCAQDDQQHVAVHLDHYFVPSNWLKETFPKHFELIEMIEAQARLTKTTSSG